MTSTYANSLTRGVLPSHVLPWHQATGWPRTVDLYGGGQCHPLGCPWTSLSQGVGRWRLLGGGFFRTVQDGH